MGFMDAVKDGFSRFLDFNGTSTRPAYWYFFLAQIIALIIAAGIDFVLFGVPSFLYYAVSLVFFIPALAVAIRRFHDAGWSGWWLLAAFVPFVGLIFLIYVLVQKSKMIDNIYRA